MKIEISELMEQSGVKFGTSGARGSVDDMTDLVCYAYTAAFLQHLENIQEIGKKDIVGIGGDLRPSTGRIMEAVSRAVSDRGYQFRNFGRVPSPALCLYGMENGTPTIMVTGSHIPDDRNGIKYTKADGEILKPDEEGIRSQVIDIPELFDKSGIFQKRIPMCAPEASATRRYISRYIDFFGKDALSGFKVGIYEHSAVGRDLLVSIFDSLGAETVRLGRSDEFIPVDTEAVREEDANLISNWAKEHSLDSIVSTDGDSDRPLVSDENGVLIRGDITGILCGNFLGADTVVTPVTSNTAAEKCGFFRNVIRTRVGSPYVIEAMASALSNGAENVCGYEANGGFLISADIRRNDRVLKKLPTRDAVIVLVSLLLASKEKALKPSQLVASLPARFTHSDRLKNFPTAVSHSRIEALETANDGDLIRNAEDVFKPVFGPVSRVDTLDGFRITFEDDDIVHLRPSGNAPEFRCYAESDSPAEARTLVSRAMGIMKTWME